MNNEEFNRKLKMSNEEFNRKLSKRLEDYVRKEFGERGIDRFAKSYVEIHSEKGLSTIKKMFDSGHSFSEEEVKNLSGIMKCPALIEVYYESLISDLESKKRKTNNAASGSNKETNPSTVNDVVRSNDVINAIENYRFVEAKTPMLIFCDNHECIEYIISTAGIEAIRMEHVAWDSQFIHYYEHNLIKNLPHDVVVGTIKLDQDSSVDSVSGPYQTYKSVIEKDTKKYFVLIVECHDSYQQKLMFKSFRNEHHVISYKSEKTVNDDVRKLKENPKQGIGWGYGSLPTVENATYMKSPFYVRSGEYLCVHEDYGVTWNWGIAIAKRVEGVNDEHFRSFASLTKYEIQVTRDVNHEDEPVSQESGTEDEEDWMDMDLISHNYSITKVDDEDDDDNYSLHYELDLNKALENREYSWYVSEYQRAAENTEKLAKKQFEPAMKAANHHKVTSHLLEGRWHLPSLVELVAARNDIEPGLYWTSSKDLGVNILYDSEKNKVVEPDGTPQKGWVMPFIIEERKS